MDDNRGWIAVHRKISEHWLWNCRPFSYGQAWIDLLLLANHKDVKRLVEGKLKVYKRGTVTGSKLFLSQRWGWERKKVTRFLKMLEDDEMVSVRSTTHGTAITIKNYADYQGYYGHNKQPMGQPQPLENEQYSVNYGQPMDITKTQYPNVFVESEASGRPKNGQPKPLENERYSGNHGQPMGQPMDNRWTTDGQPMPTNNNDNNDNNVSSTTEKSKTPSVFVNNNISVNRDISNNSSYQYSNNISNSIQGPNSDPATAAVVKTLEESGFQINQRVIEQILSMLDDYGELWVTEAIRRSSDANVRNIRYIAGILRSWQEKGGMDEWNTRNDNRGSTTGSSFLDMIASGELDEEE